ATVSQIFQIFVEEEVRLDYDLTRWSGDGGIWADPEALGALEALDRPAGGGGGGG
nr:hypothetical protein [Tanacetum cinerariifolium]